MQHGGCGCEGNLHNTAKEHLISSCVLLWHSGVVECVKHWWPQTWGDLQTKVVQSYLGGPYTHM